MLGYLSIRNVFLAIGLCTVAAAFVCGMTWLYLYDKIRDSTALQEEFYSTVRRMIITVGIFVIPVVIYVLDARRRPLNNVEPYAFAWVGCYVVSLLFLAAGLTTFMRDSRHEKKTGLSDKRSPLRCGWDRISVLPSGPRRRRDPQTETGPVTRMTRNSG